MIGELTNADEVDFTEWNLVGYWAAPLMCRAGKARKKARRRSHSKSEIAKTTEKAKEKERRWRSVSGIEACL